MTAPIRLCRFGLPAAAMLTSVALSAPSANGHEGKWQVTNQTAQHFAQRAGRGGTVVVADFDCDRRDDLIHFDATGINVLRWFNRDGGIWSQRSFGLFRNNGYKPGNVQVGDFNADGCDDLVLVNSANNAVPVIYGGVNLQVSLGEIGSNSFRTLLFSRGVTPVVGTFDRRYGSAIALVRNGDLSSNWTNLPVAYGISGTERFRVTTEVVPEFAEFAKLKNARLAVPKVGDFNGDGSDDIALAMAGAKSSILPIASKKGGAAWSLEKRLVHNVPDRLNARNGVFSAEAWPLFGGKRDDLVYVYSYATEKTNWDFPFIQYDFVSIVSAPTSWNYATHELFKSAPYTLVNGNLQAGHAPKITHVIGNFDSDPRPEIVRLFEPPYETNRTDMIDHVQNSHYNNGLQIKGKVGAFGAWRNQAGVMHFVGDYNGDGMDDIALVRFSPGWSTVPVAFSLGHAVTN